MAKANDGKRAAATSTAAAIAAVMLAAPGLAAPGLAPAQQVKPGASPDTPRAGPEVKHASRANSINYMKIKIEYKRKGEYSIVGVGDGHVVFEDERGNLFYIDEATGDQKSVARGKVFPKVEIQHRAESPIKYGNKVNIVGVDADGKVIMNNPRGEKFYLDAATGDMIFVSSGKEARE